MYVVQIPPPSSIEFDRNTINSSQSWNVRTTVGERRNSVVRSFCGSVQSGRYVREGLHVLRLTASHASPSGIRSAATSHFVHQIIFGRGSVSREEKPFVKCYGIWI
jgi:hypothetical protein